MHCTLPMNDHRKRSRRPFTFQIDHLSSPEFPYYVNLVNNPLKDFAIVQNNVCIFYLNVIFKNIKRGKSRMVLAFLVDHFTQEICVH